MYRWIVFLHILSAFGFFLAHGMATTMAFRLRHERVVGRVQALLTASQSTMPALMLSLLAILVTGVALGFMAGWWRFGWIWTSLGLLVVMTVWMGWYAVRFYAPIRRAAGLPYREGNQERAAGEPLGEEEIAHLVGLTSPQMLFLVGLGGWAVILYLMMFKPF